MKNMSAETKHRGSQGLMTKQTQISNVQTDSVIISGSQYLHTLNRFASDTFTVPFFDSLQYFRKILLVFIKKKLKIFMKTLALNFLKRTLQFYRDI